MKKLILLMLLVLALPAYASEIGYTEDPYKISLGARAMGMGGAIAAIADGSSNMFNNPAGISHQNTQVSSMYTSLLGDVAYTILGANWPIKYGLLNGGVGLGVAASNVNQLVTPSQAGFSYFDYHNNVYALSYGQKVRQFEAGLRLKVYDEGFTGGQNYVGSGYDVDLGLLLPVNNKTNLGLLCQNILPANLGAQVRWPNGDTEGIPAMIKAGLSTRHFRDDLLLAADYDLSADRRYPGRMHAGLEWSPLSALGLRTGIDQLYDTGGVSNSWTLGVGLSLAYFTFDYAYHPYFAGLDTVTHYFSLSYNMDRMAPPKPALAGKKILEIISPADRMIIYQDRLRITGSVLACEVKKVTINGIEVPLTNGQFNFEVPLKLGKNLVKVAGLDPKAKVVKRVNLRLLRLPYFPDVPAGYWAQDPIEELAALGIINGYPNGTFLPEGFLIGTEMNKLLINAKNLTGAPGAVPSYPEPILTPWGKLTRAEAVDMIARYSGLVEPMSIAERPFADIPMRHWAARIISQAKQAGLLDYLTSANFEPEQNFTRAEAAWMLARINEVRAKAGELMDFEKGYY